MRISFQRPGRKRCEGSEEDGVQPSNFSQWLEEVIWNLTRPQAKELETLPCFRRSCSENRDDYGRTTLF